MEFNNKLYELRKQKGFSQEELANRLNVSRQTISKWEVGESTPDMENLVAISELFEISLDELVLDIVPEEADTSAQVVKSEFYSDIKENVLTDENRKKAKKGLKIGDNSPDRLNFICYLCIDEWISALILTSFKR